MMYEVVKKRRNSGEKGFTLIELLVVVAIIAILAAVAVPQYMKYTANARLSNVQQLAKSIASMAVSLAATAVQNPDANCVDDNTFGVEWDDTNYELRAIGDASSGTTICDKVKVFQDIPGWLEAVDISGVTVEVQGTQAVITGGSITIKSEYRIGGGKQIGCVYDGARGVLTDVDDTYLCHLE